MHYLLGMIATIIALLLIAAALFKLFIWWVATDYKLTDEQYQEAKKTKFCIVGGGVSGILVGYFFKLMRLDFVIIERGSEIGGTWFWNTYPGVGCDVPSHLYSFSWFMNPNWSKLFSLGDEIQQYVRESWCFAGLKPHTMLNTNVEKCVWQTKANKWRVTIQYSNGSIEDIDFDWLISCVGGLHYPLYPDIEGRQSFKGYSWHTTKWNESVPVKGKRVGMIGNGASAVQILPSLLDEAKHVVMFQRTAHYCLPRFQTDYGAKFKRLMAIWPFGHIVRFYMYMQREFRWLLLFSPSIGNSRFTKFILGRLYSSFLEMEIKDEELREKLRPTFKIGCKRILISDEYYRRMNDDNFELDNSEIIKINETGIQTADKRHNLDIIIYSTGFLIKENFDYVLPHNPGMQSAWKNEAFGSYYGTFHWQTPNFCTFLGPMTALGHNSIIFMLECQMQVI